MLTRTDGIAVQNIAHKDAAVAHLARVASRQEHLDGALDKLLAADDGDVHALDHVGAVAHATVDALLTRLSDAVAVVILKPVDVRRKQRFLDILKLRLPDDRFNSFHTLINVTNERPILTHCNVFDAKV